MIIIGHKAIAYPKFKEICSLSGIASVPNNIMIWFYGDRDKDYVLSKHCCENNIKYAVYVDNIKDFMIFAALKPAYVILDQSPEIYQKIVENYLMDLKILYMIEDEEEIQILAKIGIDGVIFRDVLV
ncbi:hypothetical protein [Helicobacter sp. 13S00477-4]|uniref:hypothetical protein n=1 Tax=Helicobacter sp. 13S00477-4 TaxID=1905759 RepID=UPI000BA679F3|nr:hypothetical protein [Helicobacter sp. 13S00477-4]PAF50831.1 hypothetical protein BKH44_06695 [Helicobacter sp. 13S00477-4]